MNLLLLPLAVLLAKLSGKSEPHTPSKGDMQQERDTHRSIHGGIDLRATVLLVAFVTIVAGILQCGPGHLPILGLRLTLALTMAGALPSCVCIWARVRGLDTDGRNQHRVLAAISRRKTLSFNLSVVLFAADLVALGVSMMWFH
jgi:hypothetical protein